MKRKEPVEFICFDCKTTLKEAKELVRITGSNSFICYACAEKKRLAGYTEKFTLPIEKRKQARK
jgi:hypothetical protein